MMFSKNLKFYRLERRMTKKSLAEACGVSPMAISHYEAGSRKPGIDVLESLAAALGVGLADLLRRRNSGLAFAHGDFRKRSDMSASSQEYAREAVEESIGRLYDVVEALGGDVLPDPPECGVIPLTGDAEADAVALRAHLRVEPVGPVHGLVETLENRGVLVVALKHADERFSGMNGFVNGRPYVAVNAHMSPERNRSTVVHELAHLMFDWPGDVVGRAQEDMATAIGGAFLLPAADLARELGVRRRAVTRDMEMVAREYGVSMMMLAKRANATGIVGDGAYRAFCVAASKAGWRTSEPSRIGPERPELFEQLVYRAVCEDEIGIQRGAELLGASYDEVAAGCALCGV